ncbi:hypothetical protein ADUPG1_010259 [Aduncisulcus paluster]|uniref:Uncharacterized protein n=1 Tax=Aduncisulcus paluster TaxID=2918883 RepID=A0ABQ5JR26_9EUKA|nr:hypothetical protein ADUPG1_010259 [Aduncisulcus paluster]
MKWEEVCEDLIIDDPDNVSLHQIIKYLQDKDYKAGVIWISEYFLPPLDRAITLVQGKISSSAIYAVKDLLMAFESPEFDTPQAKKSRTKIKNCWKELSPSRDEVLRAYKLLSDGFISGSEVEHYLMTVGKEDCSDDYMVANSSPFLVME